MVLEPREIADDEELTQYGRVTSAPANPDHPGIPTFRIAPRADADSDGLSLMLGHQTADEMVRAVRRFPKLTSDDRVRYVTAGRLRDAGFVVRHTPTRKNPGHVSVTKDGEWDTVTEVEFDVCFDS